MKGFENIIVRNGGKKHSISYRGEHYTLNGVRMSKAAILHRFQMDPNELARYIGGGFKKSEAYPNTNIVSVKRHLDDIKYTIQAFIVASIVVVYVCVGIYANTTKDMNALVVLFAVMFVSAATVALSEDMEKWPERVTDFLCGVKRKEA